MTDDLFGPPAYADPDEALRELLEREQQILAMQQTDGWALWRDFLAAEQAGYQRRLLTGKHTDMLDYKWDAGFCEGIRFALGASDKLASRVSAMRGLLEESRIPDDPDLLATEDTLNG